MAPANQQLPQHASATLPSCSAKVLAALTEALSAALARHPCYNHRFFMVDHSEKNDASTSSAWAHNALMCRHVNVLHYPTVVRC